MLTLKIRDELMVPTTTPRLLYYVYFTELITFHGMCTLTTILKGTLNPPSIKDKVLKY